MIFAIIIGVVAASLMHFTFNFEVDTIILFSILYIILIIILTYWLKSKILLYTFNQMYLKLYKNLEYPFIVDSSFDLLWIKKLHNKGFIMFTKHDDYDVLYRVLSSQNKKIFRENKKLEIITIIKNNNLDFYNDLLEKEYKKLYLELKGKKININSQISIQFKKYEKLTKNIYDDLNSVIIFRDGSMNLVTINCGYFTEDNSIYFMHSKNYYPTRTFKNAVDLIKDIV